MRLYKEFMIDLIKICIFNIKFKVEKILLKKLNGFFLSYIFLHIFLIYFHFWLNTHILRWIWELLSLLKCLMS